METRLKRATIGTALWFFMNAVGWASLVVRMPEIKDRLDVTNGELGIGLFIAALGALAALRPAGIWSAKYGSAPVMKISVFAGVSFLPLIAIAPTIWTFGGTAFFFMFTIATMDMAMNAHAVAIEHESKQLIMGRMHGLWSTGGIAGGLIGGGCAALEVPLMEQALLMTLVITVIAFFSSRLLLPADVDRHEPETSADGKKHRYPLMFWILGLVCLCGTIGEGSAIDWGAILLRDEWDATPFVASIPYVVFQTAMVIGRFSSDFLSKRFGRAKVLLTCGLLTTFGLTGGLLVGDVVGVTAGWFLLGLGVSVVFPMTMSVAGALAIRDYSKVIAPSQAVSMVAGIAYGAFLAGPPLIGFLADAISLRWAMLVPAALGIGILFGSRIAKSVD